MRILYVCHQFFPSHYTGTERYTLEIAKQAQRVGHSATVLTYSIEKLGAELASTEGVKLRFYDFEGLPVFALVHTDFEERDGWTGVSIAVDDPVMSEAVDRFLSENTFDIVHCVHPMRLGSVVKLAQARGLKVVLTLMDYWLLCPRGTLLQVDGRVCGGPDGGRRCLAHCYEPNAAERIIERYNGARELLKVADVIISHSQFLIDVFRANGVDTSNFVHLRNGMDYSIVNTQQNNKVSGEPRRTINIGFLGTLLPHKGVHILIEAFKSVAQDNLRLKIYGGHFGAHDYYSFLLDLTGGDPRIEFRGEYQLENVMNVLGDIDLVVVPSVWYENAPLVISIAQMFRIPVIASRLGGMAEMITDGINGFTFEMGNVSELAEKIQRIGSEATTLLPAMGQKSILPARIETEGCLLEALYVSVAEERCDMSNGALAPETTSQLPKFKSSTSKT